MGRIGKSLVDLLRKTAITILSIPLTVLPYSCEKPPEPPIEPPPIVINPFISSDANGKAYNVLNTKEKKDAYIQAKVNEDWGNTIPPSSTDPRWDCAYYSMQLFVNSNELGENLHNKWGKDWGNHLLFNGYKGKNVDSIKYNHGTFYSMGDLGAPIYRASVIDSSHSTYGLRHVINWAATGYDLTKFEDINFTEPMDDSSNISIGRWDLPKNCDLVTLIYYYVVEDKTNGNYLQDINLEKFRIENGIPTLIWENTDQKYSIKKQRGK